MEAGYICHFQKKEDKRAIIHPPKHLALTTAWSLGTLMDGVRVCDLHVCVFVGVNCCGSIGGITA